MLSYAFSATNGLRITWDGMSTATTTLRILRLFQFNATHCFSAKQSPLLGNAFFVYLIQTSHQLQGFISFWTSGAGKSIYKNTLESRRTRVTVDSRDQAKIKQSLVLIYDALYPSIQLGIFNFTAKMCTALIESKKLPRKSAAALLGRRWMLSPICTQTSNRNTIMPSRKNFPLNALAR